MFFEKKVIYFMDFIPGAAGTSAEKIY